MHRYIVTADSACANVVDLYRLYLLELQGHFAPGFTLLAAIRAVRYVERIVLLKNMRSIRGAPAYPGPRQA